MRAGLSKKILGAAATAILALVSIGASAQAQQTDMTAIYSENSSSPIAGKDSVSLAETYWTPERMKKATPVKPEEAADVSEPAVPKLNTESSARIPGTLPKGSKPQATVSNVHSMAGKVFFVDDEGNNKVCSGSTVNSPGKRLVFTAGHCVHGGGSDRGWADVDHWVFVPNYHNGSPYGMWHASQLWSKVGWIDNNDRSYDVAAVVMQDKNGQHIVDAVGGQGIQWNYDHEREMQNFGYPSAAPFPGNQLHSCSGSTWNDSGFVAISCSYTAGASGGPWLAEYNKNSWSYLNGVNSWYFWKNDDPAYSVYKWQTPYFSDATAGSLYDELKDM